MRRWQINVCSCQRIGGKSSPSLSLRDSLRIPTRGGGLRFFNFFNGGTNTVHHVLCTHCTVKTVHTVLCKLFNCISCCLNAGADSLLQWVDNKLYTLYTVLFYMWGRRNLGNLPKVQGIMCSQPKWNTLCKTWHYMQGCTPVPLQEGAVEEHYAIVV